MIKELKNIIIIIFFLFIGGSIGYSLIEKRNFFDSLYMTIITVSTTGFREIYPMSLPGRIFTMFLIIMGISFLFYALGNLNVIIIGIYRSGTEWIYNPRSGTKLHAGDILIVIGETNDLAKMEKQVSNV